MYNRVEKERVGVPLHINLQKVEIEFRSFTVNVFGRGGTTIDFFCDLVVSKL